MKKLLSPAITILIITSALACLFLVLPLPAQTVNKLNNVFLINFILPFFALLILLFWLLSIIASRRLTVIKNNLTIPIFLLVLTRIVSVILLPSKVVSLFSYDFWIWVCFAVIFFASNNTSFANEKIKKAKNLAVSFISLTALVIFLTFNNVPSLRIINKTFSKQFSPPNRLDFKTSWAISLETLKQYPLQGIGPGLYLNAFNRFRPQSFNNRDDWAIRYSRSANLPFDILTTTGLLGFIAFGFLIYRLIKTSKFIRNWKLEIGNLLALTIVFLFLTASLFFSLPYPLLWLMFLLFAEIRQTINNQQSSINNYPLATSSLAAVAAVSIIFLLILGGFLFYNGYRAEFYFQQSLKAASQNLGAKTYQLQQKAIKYNPVNDNYHRAFSRVNFALANSLASSKKTLSDQERQQIQVLIDQAVNEAKLVTEKLNPQNSLNWELRGEIYQNLIGVAANAEYWAFSAYQQAIFLEPFNPLLRLNLGSIFYSKKDFRSAAETFKLAAQVKPDFARSRYNLAAAYKANSELKFAKQQLEITKSLLERKKGGNEKDLKIIEEQLKQIEKELQEATGSARQATESASSKTQ